MKKTIRRTFRESVRQTSSVCPVCLRQLPAEIVRIGPDYTIEKTCPEHGRFSAVVWRGDAPAFEVWGGSMTPAEPAPPDCPHACGLCASHLRKTCCVLLRGHLPCNLSALCFAA
jgi:uncharacterized radical SAM superfamily Fe-S cluster-containing enzyme